MSARVESSLLETVTESDGPETHSPKRFEALTRDKVGDQSNDWVVYRETTIAQHLGTSTCQRERASTRPVVQAER